jgi:threonyl-tRNA synthetase
LTNLSNSINYLLNMSIPNDSKNLALDIARHSFAHLLAGAVQDLFPEAMFGIGPVIDNGCYYDFILPRVLVPEDLELIERKIKTLLQRPLEYKTEMISYQEARELFLKRGQGLKVELISELENKSKLNEEENFGVNGGVTIWRIVDSKTGEMIFEDLCKGPHIKDIKELRKIGFKIDKMSSVYWRADASRESMQRVYAVLMDSPETLLTYIMARDEPKKYDHRLLGQQLDLFYFSDLVGSGLPLYTGKGTTIKNKIKDLLLQISKKYGVQEVSIPHIASIKLYEKSGHAAKFTNELFRIKDHYDSDFVLKPVNCPHHTQIYAGKPRSYRDLPVRLIESTMQFRDEKPGAIGGLTRTRGFTVDDGHTFCTVDQIKSEFENTIGIIKEFYTSMGLWGNQWVSVSVRDYDKPENYTGTVEDWDLAENMLKEIASEQGLEAKIMEGEAALYGPKIDFMYYDLQGKERQLSTIQLDFATPKRFDLSYINNEGNSETPVMIHRAILGSYERFVAILLENSKGRLPFWLAPIQVRILTINDDVLDYAKKVENELEDVVLMKPLKYNEIRIETDYRKESLNKKIKESELQKVPMIIIIGPKDMEANQVSIRTQKGESKIQLDDLAKFIKDFEYDKN